MRVALAVPAFGKAFAPIGQPFAARAPDCRFS